MMVAASAPRYAELVLDRPLEQSFSYRIPERLAGQVRPGQRVQVPFGRSRGVIGYCVGLADTVAIDERKVRDVLEVLDPEPLLDEPLLKLTRWIASYYCCAWGQVLEAVIPAGVRHGAGTELRVEYRLGILPAGDLPPKQAAVVAALEAWGDRPRPTADELAQAAGCAAATVTALWKKKVLLKETRRVHKEGAEEAERPAAVPLPALTADQEAALALLRPSLRADEFAPFLLHGVTGSGKTEVYLCALEEVVRRGREAIVLVPEISLTPQTIRRFRRRFERVAVLHSHLTDAERHRQWRRIAAGEVDVIVGARSAVFAPARRLGLIVVDEEHEATYKQDNVPRYHARDVALKRAQGLKIPVILGSATPALESWHNTQLGRYTLLELPRRVNDLPLPPVHLIDLKSEPPPGPGQPLMALSMGLKTAMERALADDGQVILMLNRRGYHTFVVCPACGTVLKCDDCDQSLTYHQQGNRLHCHTCGAQRHRPRACAQCGSPRLHYGGIGTERLEQEVRGAFPGVAVARMDSDVMRHASAYQAVLDRFRAGETRILVGTQMIAKGLDFPNVTLVGVINADTALHMPDVRAAERTFQLVAQVAGRTGRGPRGGRVLVQTFSPENDAIVAAAAHDYLGFLRREMPLRLAVQAPPYSRLVRVLARGADERAVARWLEELGGQLRAAASALVRILGPAPAPVTKAKGLYRYHIQMRSSDLKALHGLVHQVVGPAVPPTGIDLVIDVDPVHML